jgi:flagellar FliL protein
MAEETKKAPKREDSPGPASDKETREKTAPQGGNKGMFYGIIAAVVILNLVAALVLINITRPKKPEEKAGIEALDSTKAEGQKGESEAAGVTEKPVEVVVNVTGTDGQRYLKVAVSLGFGAGKSKEFGKALEEKYPVFKNMLIDILSPLTLQELMSPDTKDKIRKEMLRRVNDALPRREGQIAEVYIVDYIIQ